MFQLLDGARVIARNGAEVLPLPLAELDEGILDAKRRVLPQGPSQLFQYGPEAMNLCQLLTLKKHLSQQYERVSEIGRESSKECPKSQQEVPLLGL